MHNKRPLTIQPQILFKKKKVTHSRPLKSTLYNYLVKIIPYNANSKSYSSFRLM